MEEAALVMVIELLNDTIAPRLGHGDEPGLNIMQQAKPNQDSHPARMLTTPIKNQFIVHLQILWNPQTAPTRPDGTQGVLSSFTQHGTDGTTSRSQVDAVETVKTNRAF